jgi:hypothetical protein
MSTHPNTSRSRSGQHLLTGVALVKNLDLTQGEVLPHAVNPLSLAYPSANSGVVTVMS